MLVRSGNAASILVEFPSGHPDGNITVKVLGEDGSILDTSSVVVPTDAVSIYLTVDGTHNTLTGAVTGYRDVTWSYTTGGATINGEIRYSLEARVPFGASYDGVRSKLGVSLADVPDNEIGLMRAYLALEAIAGADNVALATDTLALRDAIEALAAFDLLPTMPVRIAVKETSGTDAFQRSNKFDWYTLVPGLQQYVNNGALAANPLYDPTIDFGSLLILASPAVDAITGA